MKNHAISKFQKRSANTCEKNHWSNIRRGMMEIQYNCNYCIKDKYTLRVHSFGGFLEFPIWMWDTKKPTLWSVYLASRSFQIPVSKMLLRSWSICKTKKGRAFKEFIKTLNKNSQISSQNIGPICMPNLFIRKLIF